MAFERRFLLDLPFGICVGVALPEEGAFELPEALHPMEAAFARVPAEEGPHLLRARCMPLISDELPFVLDAYETLKVQIYVCAPEDLRIDLDPESD